MNLEKQKTFLIKFAFIMVIGFLLYAGLKYLLPLLAPFVFGLIVAYMLRPLIDLLTNKTKLPRSLISIFCLIIIIAIILTFLITIGSKLVSFSSSFLGNMDNFYNDTLSPIIVKSSSSLFRKFPELKPFLEKVPDINQSISTFVTSASSFALSIVTNVAGMVPSFIINFLFTMVSTFFFTIDYHKIASFIGKQIPESKRVIFSKIKTNGVDSVFKFLKAYLILITITFIELAIGLTLLQVPNSILIALLIAVVDILPILGTGAILLPWIIISFIMGNTIFAIFLLILYAIITIVRQTLEPRVVGKQIGLHPIVTLICMYVGAGLFGIVGLFLLPIIATIIRRLNDDGSLKIYK